MIEGPITKIWHFTLKLGQDINSEPFQALWLDILEHCASYTERKSTDQHMLYQNKADKDSVVMITGYSTLESNLEADKVYAAKYMTRMFGLVEHRQLFLLSIDINDLPLQSDEVGLIINENKLDDSALGVGAWDQSQQLKDQADARKTWVQLCRVDGPLDDQYYDGMWTLRKFMGR
jgi:hypothetical protein